MFPTPVGQNPVTKAGFSFLAIHLSRHRRYRPLIPMRRQAAQNALRATNGVLSSFSIALAAKIAQNTQKQACREFANLYGSMFGTFAYLTSIPSSFFPLAVYARSACCAEGCSQGVRRREAGYPQSIIISYSYKYTTSIYIMQGGSDFTKKGV